MPDIEKYGEDTFEAIKHCTSDGTEFWYARELRKALHYTEYNKFLPVIQKAMTACEKSGNSVKDHFALVSEMVGIGSGAIREMDSYMLSRYACYLIVMSADESKEVIALGKTYFAVKTRQQELIDDYEQLSEDQKRIATRSEMKKHNKSLAEAAQNAGVETNLDFAIFQNNGYMGLYGGLCKRDVAKNKGLKPTDDILDNMGSTELAANLFRATQTDEKLRRDNIQGKENANRTHYEVGSKVRQTIAELGGTMPEDLPTPIKSVKKLEAEQKKLTNGNDKRKK